MSWSQLTWAVPSHHPWAGLSAKWGMHINAINAIYTIYRLMHILHIMCTFLHIFTAYFLHIRLIQSIQLHISCIFLAYYWHKPAYLKHITYAFFLAYFMHIFAYLTNTVNIFAYLVHIWCI